MTNTHSLKSLEKNWLEWCVFGTGGVLVLATVGYLAYEAATATHRPAALEVRLGRVERRSDHFAVPVTVLNRGDEAAETVLIEVQLTKRDGGTERSELQFQLLPGQASREGWATFESDPAEGKLRARPVGFQKPT